jgi:ribosomal protein S18 acetylase RimI-like enzyme
MNEATNKRLPPEVLEAPADLWPTLAGRICDIDLWRRYEIHQERMLGAFNVPGRAVSMVATPGGEPMGVVLTDFDGRPSLAQRRGLAPLAEHLKVAEVDVPLVAYLALLAVFPEHQGHGLGQHLLAGAEDEARELGAGWMSLYVSEWNPDAARLYTRVGYQEIARVPDVVIPGVTEILMLKPLFE